MFYKTARFVIELLTFRRRAVNLTGDYLGKTDACVGPDGFRPLRHAVRQLRAAA